MRTSIPLPRLAALSLMLGASLASAATLVPDLSSPRPAGSTITFTLGGDGDPANELYRLSVAPANDPARLGMVYDYAPDNVLEWTPLDPGIYSVVASVLNRATGEEQQASQTFSIDPAVAPETTSAVVLPTRHPLIALYVAPPCPPPGRMRVRFLAASGGVERMTTPKRCEPGTPLHFLIAGMRENTTYQMRHELVAPGGGGFGQSSAIPFTTGQATIAISSSRLTIPSDARSSQVESLIWNSPLIGNTALGLRPYIHATDLDGNLLWYLEQEAWPLRPSRDGTFWTVTRDPVTGLQDNVLAKLDLLGQVVKQTNVQALNHQLERLGYADRINDIHHDVRDLPNGTIAFISTVERLVSDVQGAGAVAVLGDMILVTDQNFAIQWLWNGWDHLDPTRLATLGEVCEAGAAGCPPFSGASQANDWMHTNALAETPDGNLLLSVRNQDWLIKIQYADGAGDGHVLWRLGREGDFTLAEGGDPRDWFSHTHDPSFIADNRILVYDNSNLRCESQTPPPDCQSRGQVWELDEEAMTARLVLNKDLGDYAFAVGSAQRLLNGNYWFNSGMLGTFAAPRATLQEVDAKGTSLFQSDLDIFQYRSYRLTDLYSVPRSWERPARTPPGRLEGCAREDEHPCPSGRGAFNAGADPSWRP